MTARLRNSGEGMFRGKLQDGDLEIQQSSQPDSKTYFFSMRPRRSELFNRKLLRMIKSLSGNMRQKDKRKLADSN